MTDVLCVHPHAELYGSDRVFLATVRTLRDAGDRPHVVLGMSGPLVQVLRADGFPVDVVPGMFVLRKALLRRPWAFAGLLPDTLAFLRRGRAVAGRWAYVSTVNAPGALLGLRLAGRRVVCHVHEAEPLSGAVRLLLLLPLLAATRLLSISGATSRFVAALPALRARTRALPNVVELSGDVPELPDERPERVRLAMVGRLAPRKGPDVAIRALAALRSRGVDARLDLHGDAFPGYEWFVDSLDDLTARLDLGAHVTRHGFDPEARSAYAQAHVCLVPSRVEPFGLVAVEARLAGRMTVVSDVDGLPETVDGGASTALVPPDDPAALADAVEQALQDWPAVRAAAATSRDRAATAFGAARYRRNLLAILEAMR